MAKAILFDFWGTLVDNGTYSPLRQSYNILRARMPFSEFVQKFEGAFMTKKFEEQAQGFSEACDALGIPVKSFVIDKLIGLWNKNRMLAKLYPETVQVLEELKGKKYKLAIISNTDQLITQVIEKFSIAKYFDETFFSCEMGLLKTDKKMFEQAIKKLGVKKDDVVVVGDSIETDIVGAESAGLKAVLVDRKDNREYKLKIKSLTDLGKVLEQ